MGGTGIGGWMKLGYEDGWDRAGMMTTMGGEVGFAIKACVSEIVFFFLRTNHTKKTEPDVLVGSPDKR